MPLSKFLDPKNDVAFRRIFGSTSNKDILIHFLNDILDLPDANKIVDVSFLSPIQDPDIASQKQSIVDVLCTDPSGTQLIIEMQVAKTSGFERRAQYYAAKAYFSQAEVGDQYSSLKGVIFIAITNFILFPDKLAYKSDHVTLDKVTHEHDLKDFSFTFIELPKFKKTKEDHLENVAEKWIYFFKHASETSEQDLQKIIGNDVIIGKAYDILNEFNWTKEERFAYDQAKKRTNDYLSTLNEKLNEGIHIGKEEGKIEVAKAMFAAKMDIDTVARLSGLSIDKLKEILN
ncbi:MAG: Rpn family recombination-promoting nuclease/putative transposase [Wolbachia endosymbiont of Tyrophagus putrescentiae]|nr:Rpn family recombination-promoting nuclease/putative transposase [Wolbachia endosymbiont of Tyrophagus putrescentiae]